MKKFLTAFYSNIGTTFLFAIFQVVFLTYLFPDLRMIFFVAAFPVNLILFLVIQSKTPLDSLSQEDIRKFLQDNLIEIGIVSFVLLSYVITFSRLLVPPGADSALHAFMISHFDISYPYPQGFHILANILNELLPLSLTQTIFFIQLLVTGAFLVLTIRISRSLFSQRSLPYFAFILFSVISPFFHNNLMNGSYSHNWGIILLQLLTLFIIPRLDNKHSKESIPSLVYLLLLLSISFTFHSVTYLVMISLLFIYRLYKKDYDFRFGVVSIVALLLALPLHIHLLSLGYYPPFITISLLLILVFEVALKNRAKLSILISATTIKIVSVLAIFFTLLINLTERALFTWYSLTAQIPLIFAIFSPEKQKSKSAKYFFSYWLAGAALLYFVTSYVNINRVFTLLNNLIYFYIIAIPLLYFVTIGLQNALTFISNTVLRKIILVGLVLFFLLVIAGRIDSGSSVINKVDPFLYNKYQTFDGFGVFLTVDDMDVLEYISENVNESDLVLNLGGPYGFWGFLANDTVLFRKGGVIDPSNEALKSYNTWDTRYLPICSLIEKDHDIHYVWVPSEYQIEMSTDQCSLELIYRSGESLLYKVAE